MSVRLLVARREELSEVERLEVGLQLQDGCSVATPVQVVRGREHRQGLLGVEPVETSINHL